MTLRARTIRLAASRPDLQPVLLPLLRQAARLYFFDAREVTIIEFLQYYEKELRKYLKKNKDDPGSLYDVWFTRYRSVMAQVNDDLPPALRRKINQHNRQIGGLGGDHSLVADLDKMLVGLKMLIDGMKAQTSSTSV